MALGIGIRRLSNQLVLPLAAAVSLLPAACGSSSKATARVAPSTIAATTSAASGVVTTLAPTTTLPTTTTTPATVSYSFAPDTSSADQDAIRRGIDAAQAYALKNYGPLKAPIRISVQTGADPTSATGTARASNNDVLVFTGSPGWQQNADPIDHAKVLAHEFFHVIQYQFHFVSNGQIGPTWLFEGSAEAFARSAIVDQGLTDSATAASIVGFTGWRSVRQVLPLDQLETRQQWMAAGGKATYALAAASIDILLQDHGDTDALKTYFDQFRPGQTPDWRAAFAQAFGITPADFYAHIASLRASS